jgi:phosphoglycolate phosphatase
MAPLIGINWCNSIQGSDSFYQNKVFYVMNNINLNHYKSIIWDWNGTLLDDLDLSIECINIMLEKRRLPILSTEKYLDVFTFPVQDYYEAIGFDFRKESWDIAAHEFIYLYLDRINRCRLTKGAKETLTAFKSMGLSQAIVSAMQHDALVKSVNNLGISGFFDSIGGISDHYAAGKIENALSYLSKTNIDPKQALLIGDTLHDAEVAREIGCNCVLIAAGHQSAERLHASRLKVYATLYDFLENAEV